MKYPDPLALFRPCFFLTLFFAGASIALAINEPTIGDFNGEMEPNPIDGGGDTYGILAGGMILGNLVDVEVTGAVTAETDGSSLVFDGSADAAGTAFISWDGDDEAPFFNQEGLGNVNLTEEDVGFTSQDAFLLRFASVASGGTFSIELFSGEGEASAYSGSAIAGGLTELVIPYGSFSTTQGDGAVFSGVTAMSITLGGGLVAELDQFQTTSALGGMTMVDSLLADPGGNGIADPGDTLRYTITVPAAASGTGVVVAVSPNPDTVLISGTVTTSFGVVTTGNGGGDTSVSVDVGTLPAVDLTIVFDCMISDPFGGPSPVCNQATLIAAGGASLLSDDPDDPSGSNDPTCTVVFVDTEDPVITVPLDLTVAPGGDTSPASTGTATATDNITAEPTIGFSDSVNDGPQPFQQTITRTWTATDEAGNSAQGAQIITVEGFGPAFSLADVVGRPTYGLFSPSSGSGKRQLGTITSTGGVSLLGTDSSLDAGNISTGAGITAFDRQTQTVFAVGATASDGFSRIFSISGENGSAVSAVLSSGTASTVVGIWWDEGSSTLYGVFQVGAGLADRQLASIDPGSGTVSFVGIPQTSILSTVAGTLAGSADEGEIYFLGSPGGLPGSIYTVDLASGTMTGVALSGASFNAIAGMDFSEAQGKLYALVFVGAERQLAELDPTTGVVSPLGASTVGGGGVSVTTYTGVNAIDEFSGTFLFIGRYNNGVSNVWAIWGVDLLTGESSYSDIDTSLITNNGFYGLEYGRLRIDALKITDMGFSGSDFYIDMANGTNGLYVTSSDDLQSPFVVVPGVTEVNDEGAQPNRFLIPAASLNPGKDFFRVETE